MKKTNKKKLYQLSLTCAYNEQVETHILHIGKLHTCKAVQLLSKHKQKQWIKNGSLPKEAKITYKIEKYKELQNNEK